MVRRVALFLLAMSLPGGVLAQDFSFDPSEFEAKPYELSGFIETRGEHFFLDRDAALYRIGDPSSFNGNSNDRGTGKLELSGRYKVDTVSFFARGAAEGVVDADDDETSELKLLEGGTTWQPRTGLSLDLGKKSLKWDKGYAWSPVAFAERTKDPTDPDQAREGFWMANAEGTWSLDGPIRTFGASAVVLPVTGSMNEDFGRERDTNIAGKLYFLAYDTDIDLMALAGGTRSPRYGADFSRNLTSNFEVHGEAAWVTHAERRVLDDSQRVTTRRRDAANWLIGGRYLTESETTYIVEYYRNGAGFTETEGEDFFGFADQATDNFLQTGSQTLLGRANSLAQGGFGRQNPFRDYLYARMSQKDPFDWLYVTPALSAIVNVKDGSFNVSPEIAYTGFTDWDIRLKGIANFGGNGTEFGEKQAAGRVELRVRRFF